ncbi:MAG: hypothetical protein P4L86_21725, partial [Mycobacterium sp.]|nr:hypothetical protein [Mycobacterium sp.]
NLFAPDTGGRGGEVDITGSNLLVVASDLAASYAASGTYSGYIVLDADQLSNLGVESVLLGGIRSTTTSGTLITATAKNLEVATDAAHMLSGPELLFVTKAGGSGLVVDAGSVIEAKGTVSSASSDALVIGVAGSVSGDGSLLRVSNGGIVTVTRNNVATTTGTLAIGTGTTLSGASLTLDSAGSTTVATDAVLTADNYDLSGSVINVGGGSTGLVLTDTLIAKLAGADTVSLRSASVFNFYGNVALGTDTSPIGTLTLDGAGFYSNGGSASVAASNIVLKNSQSTVSTANAVSGAGGTLTLTATDTLTFGAGTKTASGLATFAASAGTEILFTGTGSFDAGSAAVTLTAPFLVVDTSASQSLTTTGALTIQPGATDTALALASTVIGGSLTLTAAAIADSGIIVAQSGTVTLEAKTGGIVLSDNAAISATGTVVLLSDQLEYTPGGTVKLIADAGDITLGSGTTIDVSAAGQGYGGALGIQANSGTVTLSGTLNGAAATNALGGSFILAAKALSGDLPLASGFTTEFEVALSTGDITIASGQTLTAATVLLEADGGWVNVNGTIDASGAAGGTISLYGTKGVDLEGSLLATASAADQAGGTVEIGTTGTATSGSYNATYGYENVAKANSGSVVIGANAVIDVTGGKEGGTVLLRAPILDDGSVNVSVASTASIRGARSKTLEAYAVWSTTDSTTGALHFDGIVDPAGWYASTGTLLAGSFTNAGGTTVASWSGTAPTLSGSALSSTGTTTTSTSGTTTTTKTSYSWNGTTFTTTVTTVVNSGSTTTVTTAITAGSTTTTTTVTLASGSTSTTTATSASDTATYAAAVENYLLTYYYFAPSAGVTDTTRAAHETFYGYVNGTESSGAGTLMGFVENGLAGTSAVSGFTLVPGIELRNPSTSINAGNITVATNWNLGAENSSGTLLYRFNGNAPTLTLRAKNNVNVNASITDGFVETSAVGAATSVNISSPGTKTSATTAYNTFVSANAATVSSILSAGTILSIAGFVSSDLTVVAPTSISTVTGSAIYKIYGYTSATTGITTYLTIFGNYLSQTYVLRNSFSAAGYTLASTVASQAGTTAATFAQTALQYLSQANAAYSKISTSNTAATNYSYYEQYIVLWQYYYNNYKSWSDSL